MLIRLGLDDIRDPDFDCGNADLNEFFFEDSAKFYDELMSVTYVWYDLDSDKITAFLSIANDAISRTVISTKTYNRAARKIPNVKRIKTLPAVKIGRLAVHKNHTGQKIGSTILDRIKDWFTDGGNKTGCRFIVVDALNNPKTIHFYEQNKFKFLLGDEDINEPTRLMFFDLITIKP